MKHKIFITTGIILLFTGIMIFMIGYHGIDLIFNYQHLSAQMNQKLLENGFNAVYPDIDDATDKTASGKILTLDEVYRNGLNEIFIGLIITATATYILGASIWSAKIK